MSRLKKLTLVVIVNESMITVIAALAVKEKKKRIKIRKEIIKIVRINLLYQNLKGNYYF